MKKLLALLIALMLLTVASAEPLRIESTMAVSQAPGLPDAAANFLTALTLRTYAQGEEQGFTLLYEGKELFSLATAHEADTWYIATSLAEGTVAFEADALLPTLARIAESLGEQGVLPAETAAVLADFLNRFIHPASEEQPNTPQQIDWSLLTKAFQEHMTIAPDSCPASPAPDSMLQYDTRSTWVMTTSQACSLIQAMGEFIDNNKEALAQDPLFGGMLEKTKLWLVFLYFGISFTQAEIHLTILWDSATRTPAQVDLEVHEYPGSQDAKDTFLLGCRVFANGTSETCIDIFYAGEPFLTVRRADTPIAAAPALKDGEVLRIDLLDGDALVSWVENTTRRIQSRWAEIKALIPQILPKAE